MNDLKKIQYIICWCNVTKICYHNKKCRNCKICHMIVIFMFIWKRKKWILWFNYFKILFIFFIKFFYLKIPNIRFITIRNIIKERCRVIFYYKFDNILVCWINITFVCKKIFSFYYTTFSFDTRYECIVVFIVFFSLFVLIPIQIYDHLFHLIFVFGDDIVISISCKIIIFFDHYQIFP